MTGAPSGSCFRGGQAYDAVEGRLLLDTIGRLKSSETDKPLFLLMDRAYEDLETRLRAFEWGYSPVVPPKKNRKDPWKYDRELYKRRNGVERMFRRLKRFRRIGTHYDKLDVVFSALIRFAWCLIAVCSLIPYCVNTP
jgi:transposase